MRKVLRIFAVTITLLSVAVKVTTPATSSLDFNHVQLNSNDVQLSPTEDANRNHSGSKCFTDAKLELLKYVIIGFAAGEIRKGNSESIPKLLDEINASDERTFELIVESAIDDDSLTYLMDFVQNSNEKLKLRGYVTVHREITTNESKNIIKWLQLHAFLKNDSSVKTSSELMVLLNEIESKTNQILDSMELYEFESRIDDFITTNCGENAAENCERKVLFFEHLIKRAFSNDVTNIPKILSFIHMLKLRTHKLQSIYHLLTEIEQTHHLNYTILVIPFIKAYVPVDTWNKKSRHPELCTYRKEILRKFPTNSNLRKLLSRNEIYIRNVFNNEYLSYKSLPKTYKYRPITDAKEVPWKLEFDNVHSPHRDTDDRFSRFFIDFPNYYNSLSLDRNEIQDEWYVIVSTNSLGGEGTYYMVKGWIFESDDMLGTVFRIKNEYTSEYLGVGQRAHQVVMFSDINDVKTSKIEWILESRDSDIDSNYLCKDST